MRTVVLLPGLDGTDVMYRPLVRTAPPDVLMRTVTYPAGPANAYEDLLPGVRKALPGDRPFYLLGWSFSGPMALMASAENPPGLKGVVLVSTFVRRPIALVPRWARHLARSPLFGLFPLASRAKSALGGYSGSEIGALLVEALSLAGPEALASRARAALAVDARRYLAACRVPLLYIRARSDGVIRRSAADEIRHVLPAAVMAEIEGPHLALVMNPRASWAELLKFMNLVERSLRPDPHQPC